MKQRLSWIDQARGLSILAVVYGHNFPLYEPYIYSFHVPLFFFIAGMFHPKDFNFSVVKKRAKMILLPYFIWAFVLYLFWLLVGRNLGDSADITLSPLDNLIGIFYAQGGQTYMDWGIPLWFIPCIFLVFLIYGAVLKITRGRGSYVVVGGLVLLGFLWPRIAEVHLPWSLDVALVSLGFYVAGKLGKEWMIKLSLKWTGIVFLLVLLLHVGAFYLNPGKVDMYRSLYGNEALFFVSGLLGSLAYVLFFKLAPVFSFLAYLGRHTIVLLATHLRMLSAIKLLMLLILGITVFEFSEPQKVLLSFVQVILAVPVIWAVNKYAPILDGKIKKP